MDLSNNSPFDSPRGSERSSTNRLSHGSFSHRSRTQPSPLAEERSRLSLAGLRSSEQAGPQRSGPLHTLSSPRPNAGGSFPTIQLYNSPRRRVFETEEVVVGKPKGATGAHNVIFPVKGSRRLPGAIKAALPLRLPSLRVADHTCERHTTKRVSAEGEADAAHALSHRGGEGREKGPTSMPLLKLKR